MRNNQILLLTLLFLVFQAGSASADSSERDAVLTVMDNVFAAVRSGRPEDWRAIQLAEGSTLSFRPHPGGKPEELEMRISNNEKFIADLEPDGEWKIANVIMARMLVENGDPYYV